MSFQLEKSHHKWYVLIQLFFTFRTKQSQLFIGYIDYCGFRETPSQSNLKGLNGFQQNLILDVCSYTSTSRPGVVRDDSVT